jgi:hypothetical protein
MAFESDKGVPLERQKTYSKNMSAIELWTTTIKVWVRNIIPYILLIGVIVVVLNAVEIFIAEFLFQNGYIGLPSDILNYLSTLVEVVMFPGTIALDLTTYLLVSFVFLLIGLIINAVLAGAGVKLAIDTLSEDEGTLGKSLGAAFSKAPGLILVLLVISLLNSVLLSVPSVLLLQGMVLEDLNLAVNGLGFFVVSMVLVSFITVRFQPVFGVVMTEDCSTSEALSRSFALTKGNFWHIVIGYILTFMVIFMVESLFGLLSGTLASFYGDELGIALVTLISMLFTSSMMYAFQGVLYKDLVGQTIAPPAQEYW